jgi:PAS domain S-box-containing protein
MFNRFPNIRSAIIFYGLISLFLLSVLYGHLMTVSEKRGLLDQAEYYISEYAEITRYQIIDSLDESIVYLQSMSESLNINDIIDQSSKKETIENLHSFLDTRLSLNSDFLEFFIIDTNGIVLISTNERQVQTNKANRIYFQEGMNGLFIEPVYHKLTLQKPVLTIALPIEDPSGTTAAVLGGHINVERWDMSMLPSQGLGDSGTTYLVNDYNFFVTSPKDEAGYAFERTNYSPGVNSCLEGKDTIGKFNDYKGSSVIGAYYYLERLEMCLIAEISEAEVLQPLSILRWHLLYALFLIISIGTAITLILSREITQPIKTLVQGTNLIKNGDFSYRVSIKTKNEFGVLASTFNQMSEQLAEIINDLQERIRELHILNQISQRVSQEIDLEKLLSYLANHVADLINGSGAFIVLLDDKSGEPKPVAAYGSFHHQYRQIKKWLNEPTLTASVIEIGSPIAVYDTHHSPYISRRIASQFPDKSLLGIPLIIQDKPIGAILIGESRYHRNFTQEEINLATSAASTIASAINTTKLLDSLQKSEIKYRRIFENIQDIYFQTNREGIITEISPSVEYHLKIPRQQLLGSPLIDLFSNPSDFEKLTNDLELLGLVEDFEVKFTKTSRENLFVSINAHFIDNNSGENIHIEGIIRNINMRKKAEVELNNNRERLNLAVEGTGAGLWDWNVQTGETIFNQRWAAILGYSLEELKPISIQTWIDLTHPDDLKKSNDLLQKHFKGETDLYVSEARMLHKDGHWVWIIDRGKVVEWDESGKPKRMAGTHIDFTDQVNSRIALAESEARYRGQFNAVADGILMTDDEWKPQFVNPAFCAITGYTKEDILEYLSPYEYLISDRSHEISDGEIIHSLTKDKIWKKEIILTKADGEEFDADITITPFYHEQDELFGFVIILRDITRIKEFSRTKSRFVSTVSHELRTPLSIISLFVDNLVEFYDRLEETERKTILSDIQEETYALHQLIQEVLLLSRLDAGKTNLNITEFDLSELLQSNILKIEQLAKDNGIMIDQQIPDEQLFVQADRDKIQQVFRNLLNNAIKFSPNDGNILINAERNENTVRITFKDSGIGIPAKEIPHLFDRFYRGSSATKQEITGSGLGLSIVKEILDLHNGEITVQSEVNMGSKFTIILPIDQRQING